MRCLVSIHGTQQQMCCCWLQQMVGMCTLARFLGGAHASSTECTRLYTMTCLASGAHLLPHVVAGRRQQPHKDGDRPGIHHHLGVL